MRIYIFKSLPVICFLLSLSFYSQGQTGANNFPATGNASVGTGSAPNTFTVNGSLITNGTIAQTGGTVSSTSGFTTYMQTNQPATPQPVNLAPGLLVYGDRWFNYGIDLGYNSIVNHYRTRIFSSLTGDVALSYINEIGTIPTTQSNFTDGLVMLGGSGNVLIGKLSQTNSSYKLDVGGNVRADKITVNTTGADFVFDSAYTLPVLSELAVYLKANHHLPQIASAAEMQKNGLDLGENQARILQKVEELTLYAIEADKQIQLLNASISRQAAIMEDQQRTLKEQQQLLLKLQAKYEGK